MKVLLVINSLILAGAEVLLKDLALRFQARGISVTIAVLKVLDGPLEHELQQAGIPFLAMPGSGIYSPNHIFALARHMGEYDLVHVHLFPAQLWAAMAAGISKPECLVTTEHNPWNNRRRGGMRPLDRWFYRRYRKIACNSEATASSLADWVPEVESKIEVVPNGINVQRFAEAVPAPRQEVLGASSGGPLLVSVARFEPQKDHATLLRALARVPEAHLALVGDGELRGPLEAQAKALGIAGRVHFLGRRPDVPQLLKMSDAFVHSTHSDGFCLSALEAMAAGIPVIASNVPGLADVVGNAGILFPAGDDLALAAAISSLLASENRRKEFSAAGSVRAHQFGIDATVEAYVRFYEAAIGGLP